MFLIMAPGSYFYTSWKDYTNYCASRSGSWIITNWKWQRERLIYRLLSPAMEKAMATHSSTLAWKIPWMEEPGGLQSMGSLRVGHDWATSLSLLTFMHWRRKWQPTQCSCLENPRDGGAWWAAVYGVTQSRTRLKWLSSSSGSSPANQDESLCHPYSAIQ